MDHPKRSSRLRRCGPAAWAALALLLSACAPSASHDRNPKTLVRLADDDIKGIDPQASSDLATMRVASEQFEGAVRLDAQGLAEPGLASAWHESADGLTWRFEIRPGLRFSDGHPIGAPELVSAWQRLTAPGSPSPLRELARPIKTMVAQGAHTLLVALHHPVPHLPELMAHPALAALPLHRAKWATERPITASGAYRLTEWVLNDHVLLEPNPAWHDGRARIAKVIWKPVTDSLTGMRSFLGRQADIASEFPASRLPDLTARLGNQVHIAPYRGSYYFAFNTRRPPFDDVRLRRALGLVVDRDWLTRSLMATGVSPAQSVVPPALFRRCNQAAPLLPPKAQRLSQARTLLQQAGYGPSRPLRFAIRFNSDTDHKRTAVALAAMWAPLGVKADLLNSEASLHFASLRRGEFELARSGWIGDVSAPENFLSIHRSDAGPSNYSGYANPHFDAALDAAEREPDAQRRACAMRHAANILAQDVPVLPLWFYVSKSLVSDRVAGWQDNLANAHPSRTLWFKQ